MSYTVHTWKEEQGNGGQKAGWLNNAETQYTAIADYSTNTTHDTLYYLQAENSKYFSSTNQGETSGFVLEYLDGYSGDQLLASGVAPYCVAVWSGSIEGIPTGWHLCDGSNGTPDLRDKFVVGAGGSYTVNTYGGVATVTSSGNVTLGGHALTTDEIPNHSHTLPHDSWEATNTAPAGGVGAGNGGSDVSTTHASTTTATGGGATHTHPSSTIKGLGTAGNNLPAYYALAFIMRVLS
jgi:hypothetical protein